MYLKHYYVISHVGKYFNGVAIHNKFANVKISPIQFYA